MGRTCQLCGRERPNERFGGRGYGARVCRECRQLPKAEQQRILATDEVWGLLEQSNISAKNVKRLEVLVNIDDGHFQTLRTLVLDIARVTPRKKRRWKILREQHPNLYRRLKDCGVISDWLVDMHSERFEDIWVPEHEPVPTKNESLPHVKPEAPSADDSSGKFFFSSLTDNPDEEIPF